MRFYLRHSTQKHQGKGMRFISTYCSMLNTKKVYMSHVVEVPTRLIICVLGRFILCSAGERDDKKLPFTLAAAVNG